MKNQTSSKYLKSQTLSHSKQGFGMIEVVIAMAMLFILSLGVTNLFTNMQKEQKRQNLIAFLGSKKAQFESAIKNEKSWSNTVENVVNNPKLKTCIITNWTTGGAGTCSGDLTTFADAAPTPQNHGYNTDADNRLVLMDGGSPAGVIYDGRLAGAGATNNGFTDNGVPCSTFNPTPLAGNDACPIGFYISWTAESDTTDPKIRVFVKMIYNGSSTTNSFQTFFNAESTSTIFNDRYDVEVHRTARNVSKSFIVISHISTSGGGCSTGGFGACENSAIPASYYGALMERPDEDKFNLVSYNSPGGGYPSNSEIVFSEGGSFACSLVTYGFRVGTITTTVETDQSGSWVAVPGGEATGFAGVPTAGFATLVTNFNLNNISATKKIRFRQVCSRGRDAAVIAAGDLDCQLGFKSSYSATSNARAVLTCSSLSD